MLCFCFLVIGALSYAGWLYIDSTKKSPAPSSVPSPVDSMVPTTQVGSASASWKTSRAIRFIKSKFVRYFAPSDGLLGKVTNGRWIDTQDSECREVSSGSLQHAAGCDRIRFPARFQEDTSTDSSLPCLTYVCCLNAVLSFYSLRC